MTLELKAMEALCSLERFVINGVKAEESDFGNSYDAAPNKAPQYGCGNRVFETKHATNKVLKKYNIDADEYNEICEKLEDILSFGRCGWCV